MNRIAQASKWQQKGFEPRLPSYAWESGVPPPSYRAPPQIRHLYWLSHHTNSGSTAEHILHRQTNQWSCPEQIRTSFIYLFKPPFIHNEKHQEMTSHLYWSYDEEKCDRTSFQGKRSKGRQRETIIWLEKKYPNKMVHCTWERDCWRDMIAQTNRHGDEQ